MSERDDSEQVDLAPYPLSHERGYFVAPRSLDELEPLCQKPLALAVYLLLSCRVRSTPGWAQGSHGPVHLSRGQCLAGENELAKKLKVNSSAARRALVLLERLGLITRKAKKRGSIITLCKYGEYGAEPNESDEAAKKPRRSGDEAATKRRRSGDEAAKSNERLTDNGQRPTGNGEREDLAAPPASPAPSAKRVDAAAKEVDAATKDRSGAKTGSDHQALIAAFSELYKLANNGAKPTWGAKQGNLVKSLLKAHGLDECIKRATNMFQAPPSWPPPPYDLGTLSANFDKFAVPHKSKPNGSVGHYQHTGREKYGAGEFKL